MAKIHNHKNQFRVTVSPDILRSLGWNKDTEVIVFKHEDRILIERLK